MKKIAVFAVLMILSIGLQAQNYKPLEKVEVPDFPSNKITIDEKETLLGETYYTATHLFHMRGLSLELGVPPVCDMHTTIRDAEIPQGSTAIVSMGGQKYYLTADFVMDGSIYIDIDREHIKHMSVSGMQSIEFLYNYETIYKQEYNLIEQELWRWNAAEFIAYLDKFKLF